jgi:pyruvate dehydrogenase E2 component (dihydrolipoamide acetyltransferase)
MATLLRVPEVAAGATEAILSEWLIQENASFSAGEPIVVLETEKAVVEVEAEIDAVLLRTLVLAGSAVEVGSPMALLGDSSEKDADLDELLAQLGVGEGTAVVKEASPRREAQGTHQAKRAPMLTEEPTPAAEQPAEPAAGHARGDGVGAPIGHSRVFISPLARRLLKDAGVPIEAVTGTGPNRRIVRRDVERAVETSDQEQGVQAATSSAEPSSAQAQSMMAPSTMAPTAERTARFTDFPHSRLRRAVANRLTQSKQTIPHFYVKRTARIDALLDLRAQLNGVSEQKISVNDLVIRAVAAAHQQVPEANVTWTENAIRRFDSVDIAVAIAGERGLVTPVLRSVETTSLSGIARSVKEFVQLANDGKLQQRDLEGGTISVTNLGMYGVEEFTAIINPPHAAILAVGAGRPAPAVVDGVLAVTTQMTLVLSVDHRAIDGAIAARWMDVLVHVIEEPLRLVV